MNKKLRKWFRGLTAGKAVHFLLALLWFGLTLFPLYFTVVSSLKLDNEIWDTMFQLPSIPQWENYFKAAETAGILSAIVNSVVISLGSVAIMIVCVMMSSYVIARRLIKRAKALNLYLLAALMIPLQGAIVPIVQMVGAVGGKNNFFVLMLIYVGLNISISSFILVGYIGGISREIDEAAAIDGCGPVKILYKIICPMLSPSLVACALFQFMWSCNDFMGPLLYVTTPRKYPMAIFVKLFMDSTSEGIQWNRILALSLISIIPQLLVFFAAQDSFIDGIAAGSVKG